MNLRAWRAPSLFLFVVTLLTACGPAVEIITTCESKPNIEAICGFQNPEDLALLDDGGSVLVSQMGAMDGSLAGDIALLDLSTNERRVVFDGDALLPVEHWGDPNCPGPPGATFGPHGLDLVTRTDGKTALLVANHGGRESIEFLEVNTDDGGGASLVWRGCAVMPEGAFINDVAGLADGGFVVTHMMPINGQMWALISSLFGADTGFVYEWSPTGGFAKIEGTDGAFPNGVELSADETEVYVNLYFGNEVRRINRTTGELLASAPVVRPDNSTWRDDGKLLVAGHSGATLRAGMTCTSDIEGACPIAFEIWALDPKTLDGQIIFSNEGPPMGAGTVALDIGDDLLIGSFSGDRLIRVTP
jgi:hypothetical protein